MPIYEYECSKGHRFEELQKISDEPLTACKECGKPVRKLVSQTAFALKGGGWYQDGYTSGSSTSPQPSQTTSDSSSTKESSAKDKKDKPAISAEKGDAS